MCIIFPHVGYGYECYSAQHHVECQLLHVYYNLYNIFIIMFIFFIGVVTLHYFGNVSSGAEDGVKVLGARCQFQWQ